MKKIYTYKVIDGEYKGKTVKSFENTVFMHSNAPIDVFDVDDNKYTLLVRELYLVSWIEVKYQIYTIQGDRE